MLLHPPNSQKFTIPQQCNYCNFALGAEIKMKITNIKNDKNILKIMDKDKTDEP